MGSYLELRLASLYLGSVKDEIDALLITLFRETDKRILPTATRDIELVHDYALKDLDEDEVVSVVQYVCSASVAKDRLDLMGFTTKVAKLAFGLELKDEIERYEAYTARYCSDFFSGTPQILRGLTPEKWLTTLKEIRDRKLKPIGLGNLDLDEQPTLLQYMLSHDWYGFPGYDQRHFLRLVLESCPETAALVYDLTDLHLSGWVDGADDLVEYATYLISDDFVMSRRTIVLTEGNTDRWILERSLNLLYPHLSDYFSFLDFEGARIGGGAGALANIVKAFAGAGIVNRIVAVFDNDTAAEAAIQTLDAIYIPSNITILQYPALDLARNYPTIGPSGPVSMDVNGLAGSIELYLGTDILSDNESKLTPVQWRGFDRKLGKYQGEVLNKSTLQHEFDGKLEACEKDTSQINRYDWTGLQSIISEMRKAFQERDATEILGRISGN